MLSCSKRLKKELAMLSQDSKDDNQITLSPSLDSIMRWKATIIAPEDSVYSGFKFNLNIEVPQQYPLIPPIIVFETKIFHPNINFDSGEICLDILKKEWTPAWSLQSSCRAIIAILTDYDASSPLNCDAGNMIRANDMRAFQSLAKMYCMEFAIPI